MGTRSLYALLRQAREPSPRVKASTNDPNFTDVESGHRRL
jgi:hypothetical protein